MTERPQQIEKVIRYALEASIFVSPTMPGLTPSELEEVGRRFGFQRGELADAQRRLGSHLGFAYEPEPARVTVEHSSALGFTDFNFEIEHDFRNFAAFQFVADQFEAVARARGQQSAIIERSVLVARAVADGIPRDAIETAITMFILDERVVEDGGTLRSVKPGWITPKAQRDLRAARRRDDPFARDGYDQIHATVRDVVARRTDGRAASADSLDAFGEFLERRSERDANLWWRQTVAELRCLSPAQTPTAVVTLASALIEGAALYVANAIPDSRTALLASAKITAWRFDRVLSELRKPGRQIFDSNDRSNTGTTAARALAVNEFRQRIHLGRILPPSSYPRPDMRPEDATEALETASRFARALLDWIELNPLS